MLHDSTIAKGNAVPVTKLKTGKKINFMKTNIIIIEKNHPLSESSFHNKNQNFLKKFFNSFFVIICGKS